MFFFYSFDGFRFSKASTLCNEFTIHRFATPDVTPQDLEENNT
jgi:hypothetical protein